MKQLLIPRTFLNAGSKSPLSSFVYERDHFSHKCSIHVDSFMKNRKILEVIPEATIEMGNK
jgi:hypothetical protein